MKRSRGFTLIELMVAVAIIGILAMIAYPSYEQYVLRARRSAGQQFALDVAQRLEQYLLDNRQYTNVLGAGGLGVTLPADVAQDYSAPVITLPAGAGPPSFRIEMTPRGRMAADGRLLVFNTTQRWRDMNGDFVFTPGVDQPW